MIYHIAWETQNGRKGVGKLSFTSINDAAIWFNKLSNAWKQNTYWITEKQQ